MANLPLSDYGVEWFKDILGQIIAWFREQLLRGYQTITTDLFATPLPDGTGLNVVLCSPDTGEAPWYSIYQTVVTGEVLIVSLVILFLSIQGRHFARIFNLGSPKTDRRTRRSAWTGGILIVSWYWIAVLALYMVQALTIGLIPDISQVGTAVAKLLPDAALNPVMTLVLTTVAAISLSTLKSIFFLREVLLYVYLYGMPIGLAFAFGNLPVVSRIAARFCRQFIPLVVLPIPAAVLFRGYGLLFGGEPVVSPTRPLFGYVVAISLPVVGLYVTWKTFRYAAPLVTGALARTSRTAATLGAVAGMGAAVGGGAAATTARYGPRAGMMYAAVQRVMDGGSSQHGASTTTQDNVTTDRSGDGGIPAYRRRENDPGHE
ncbi:hypothetical protein GRX01_05455 [Halobaculum sp. WSA2]|uniref:Type IV secretion system protein TrbL n=1 Tax=Halobaculum saliterrae TaxID=2073113 RepID=A0A6B0SQK9_9EURY|nr:hypothetical protein [Halobaculum saliterrae]MXR40787.1 hypothetical protein [Halobaculum saliterrae]